ncbi:MAG: hypothetical protein E7649_01455 [Ruminococcaceae bacterium]|nr:hypothetical protein [Oscillospiraceae bacterium]
MAISKFERWKEQYGLEYVRRLAEEGLCEEDIAARCGITLSTFRIWKILYPEFYAAIELGRSGADYAVIQSLYKKATGYSVTLNKTVKLKRVDYDPQTGKKLREYEELATAVDESHIPPDLRAGIFWLKNRQPDRWQDKQEREGEQANESMGGVVEIPSADMIDSPAEL